MFGEGVQELEKLCGVTFTEMLKGELEWGRRLKKDNRRVDCILLSERCADNAPLIAEVEGWVA